MMLNFSFSPARLGIREGMYYVYSVPQAPGTVAETDTGWDNEWMKRSINK